MAMKMMPTNGTGKVRLSDKQEFTREEKRLNRRAPPKVKAEKKSHYERQLDKFGFTS